jgi:hypothetical protein
MFKMTILISYIHWNTEYHVIMIAPCWDFDVSCHFNLMPVTYPTRYMHSCTCLIRTLNKNGILYKSNICLFRTQKLVSMRFGLERFCCIIHTAYKKGLPRQLNNNKNNTSEISLFSILLFNQGEGILIIKPLGSFFFGAWRSIRREDAVYKFGQIWSR